MPIQVGADAPDFELPSNLPLPNGTPGKPVKLSDYRGKKNVVLAFYPLDFSPTCTGEHACFVEDHAAFAGSGAEVLGVSVDSKWAHAAYADKMKIGYPLLADFQPRGAMAEKYGLYYADKGITARATVIVDKQGKVAFVKEEPIGEGRDNKAILAALAKLK